MNRLLVVLLACAACATAKPSANGDGGGTGADGPPGTDAPPGTPDGAMCAHQPCSLVPQCGCTGMACDLDSNNFATGGTLCRPAGAGTEATTCTADSDCVAGNSCVGGRCQKWCATDVDCTSGPGALCVVNVTYGTPAMPIPGAIVCSTDCDPASKTPAGCPATWGCHIYREQAGAMRFLSDCDPGGAAGAGGACTSNASCQPGMDCISVTRGSPPVTTKECHPSCICANNNCGATTCAAGTGSCQAFSTKVIIGTREYGVCL